MSPVPLFSYSPPPGATLESRKNELIIYCLVYPPWGGYLGGLGGYLGGLGGTWAAWGGTLGGLGGGSKKPVFLGANFGVFWPPQG